MCPNEIEPEAPGLWKWDIPDAICQLPQLHLSCFGCCGYDWATIEPVKKQIVMNTFYYTKLYSSKEAFADSTIGITDVGVCKGVVNLEDGSVGCPLHPKQNDGKDLRTGDCLRNYECNALRHYKKWPRDRRLQFLEHVARGNFDTYSYSMANANNTLIISFLETSPPSFASRLKEVFTGNSDGQ
jgi:hypothetical protein